MDYVLYCSGLGNQCVWCCVNVPRVRDFSQGVHHAYFDLLLAIRKRENSSYNLPLLELTTHLA